ncbi:MAG: hypothetical protein ABFR33_09415 [Verrucomicrobiota bacterium]
MRSDILQLLERQAAWQRSRAAMPWADKLRASLAMRATLGAIRSKKASAARQGNGR